MTPGLHGAASALLTRRMPRSRPPRMLQNTAQAFGSGRCNGITD